MAKSKAAKQRQKNGHVSTGTYALSYDAQKGAAYAPEVKEKVQQDRRQTKQNLRDQRNWEA